MSLLGDGALAERTSALLTGGDAFVVARVADGRARVAARGVPLESDVEIGSVSKGLTGLLLHDAIDRGEVTLDTRLGEHLDVGDGPIADLSLGSLATHRSGLPRLAPGGHVWRRTLRLMTHGENPYGETLAELLVRVRDLRPGRARPRYSNLGFMLLGHAVASAVGLPYARLVRERLAQPLSMTGVRVPSTPDGLGPHSVAGTSRRGRTVAAWTGEALAPAGGIRATADDLARLLGALLDGSAPGISALEPVARLAGPGVRIGAAWLTTTKDGREITWHNGGTGGFRSLVGIDRDAGRGVALVRATNRSADTVGLTLLTEADPVGVDVGRR
ncbi:serine hydrolase [Nostocoides sp. F2B08]|uniref:serine hydrolase domain-containing protein n=1 Tax=Nostocoides sp. F2B08 TaxID=2653936 RepID=UPI001263AB3D|nr:serine hydrolase domain-containing protein [Tetrasphaera sp. F2B08]KAB7746282.1 serine hydrolase [Tetrasphaera sp. F2B08]